MHVPGRPHVERDEGLGMANKLWAEPNGDAVVEAGCDSVVELNENENANVVSRSVMLFENICDVAGGFCAGIGLHLEV